MVENKHKNDAALTYWGENLNIESPLPEYPRPQLWRQSFFSLNGVWSYAVRNAFSGLPDYYDGEIVVPYTPECVLSGIYESIAVSRAFWYRKYIVLPKNFNPENKVILNFGAVSQCCTVYLNGIPCGVHDGGYTAFSIDITSYLTKKENVLEVEVYSQAEKGEYSYSYQRVIPAGNCHTIQSGIWKTVWLESVPPNYIKNVKTTPLYDQSSVIFQITAAAPLNADIRISENGLLVARGTCDKDGFCKVKLRTFRSWTPEKPFLYDVRICLDEDTIETYFGMRKFSYIKDDKGHLRFALNNEPYFISGISSKGLWSDGLYTPAADQALIADVVNARNMGFNTLRLAGKVEAMRFYYHCDRIGMLVWQDFPYGGQNVSPRYTQKLPCMGLKKLDDTKYRHFGRKSHDGRGAFLSEMNETIQELYSSVCVAVWGIFNEGQGQFDALQMCEKVWAADPTRLVDHASGWHDQGGSDIKSCHCFKDGIRLKADGRLLILSAFGGFSLADKEHITTKTPYSFRNVNNDNSLACAMKNTYEKQVLPLIAKGLTGCIYAQLTDVEEEVNGLFTFDRRWAKQDEKDIAALNLALFSEFREILAEPTEKQ